MRAQHIQILDIKWPTTAGEVIIYLPVVVKTEHALFGDLLAREIVRLHLDVRRQLGH